MNTWSIVLSFAALLLSGCSDWEGNPRGARAERAQAATGDVVIGVVWPTEGPKSDLWEGIDIAASEINAAGGVLGRKLRIVKQNEQGSLAQGRQVAQEFARDRDMVAVIGHLHSYIALPASSIYQDAGLLYITPGASDIKINKQGYDLVFRTIASNRTQGVQLAEYMAARGYRRVAILYEKATETQNLANFFEQRARELDLTIVDRRSYVQGSKDFRVQITSWKDLYKFDAVFLGTELQDGSAFITQARRLGLAVPIVGGEGLDTAALLKNKDAQGVVVPEQLATGAKDGERYRHFSSLYRDAYKRPPATHAVLGYDTLRLLADTMREAKTTSPQEVAKALHTTTRWIGAAGELSFDSSGDIPSKRIGLKQIDGDQFVDVACSTVGPCSAGGTQIQAPSAVKQP